VNKINLKPEYLLAICSLLFFIIYSYIAIVATDKFVSPDEVANYKFAQLYSQTGELSYSEDLNDIAEGIIYPRGSVFTDGKVTSTKFLGFQVINGTIAIIIPEIIRFLTPLLAIVGALFFYFLIRDVFNSKIALLSYFLLLILPTYWYWSSLSMFENIAGCVMMIISFRYFFNLLNTYKMSYYILFGLFFGISLFIRPDYILVVIPLTIILLWNIRKINKLNIIWTLIAIIGSIGPFFILNNKLYGSPLITGQHVQYNISQTFLSSQFNIQNLFVNTANLINLMPVIFICTLLGIIFWVKNNSIKSQYFIFSIMCFLAFSLYYFTGRVLPSELHSSYGRYILLASILFLPFVSYFILNFRSKIVPIFLVLILVVFNVLTVIPPIQSNLKSVEGYALLSQNVASVTEPDAVIFLDYWDKAIFPERRVGLIREIPEDNKSEMLSEIAIRISKRNIPVYFLISKEFEELITKESISVKIQKNGYILIETSVNKLYKLKRI